MTHTPSIWTIRPIGITTDKQSKRQIKQGKINHEEAIRNVVFYKSKVTI